MSLTMLVADDSSTIQKVIKIALSKYAVQIVEAGSFIEALGATSRDQYQLLIVDASLPGARGPDDFKKLREQARGVPMLLLVGSYENVDENAFRVAGLQGFVKKPFESRDIVDRVDELLDGALKKGPGNAPQKPPRPVEESSSGQFSPEPHPATVDPGDVPDSDSHTVPPPPPLRREPSAGGFQSTPTEESGSGLTPAAEAPGPSSGITDEKRKGRPAFGENPASSTQNKVVPEFEREETPAPVSFSTPTQTMPRKDKSEGEPQKRHATTTYIPPSMGFDEWDQMQAGRGQPKDGFAPSATAETNPRRTIPGGGDSEDVREESNVFHEPNVEPPPPGPGMPRTPDGEPLPTRFADDPHYRDDAPQFASTSQTATGTMPTPIGEPLDFNKVRSALGDLLESQLPELVHGAVETYLATHFKEIAREVLTQEIRRLADEKARHLVDN